MRQNYIKQMRTGLAALIFACGRMAAEEPLAIFEAQEITGINWPQTLITYELHRAKHARQGKEKQPDQSNFDDRSFSIGPKRIELSEGIRPGEARLVNALNGQEIPYQLWRVRLAKDGTVESARLSFFTDLKANSRFRYELHRGQSSAAPPVPPAVLSDSSGLILENGRTAIRLPPVGEQEFHQPLAWGQNHKTMVASYTDPLAAGFIPGPIKGFRLADGQWAGGSYFWSSKTNDNPVLTRMRCDAIEQGLLFVEARVRYDFQPTSWYEMTVRLCADDSVIEIDEQFDFKRTGNGWSQRLVVSLSSGWREQGWKPDVVYGVSPENRMKHQHTPFLMALEAAGFTSPRNPFSISLAYDQPHRWVCNLASWYPWNNETAWYFGLVRLADVEQFVSLTPNAVAVVPLNQGSWRGDSATHSAMLFTHQADDVALHWMLMASPHPRNLLHTGEYDPMLPLTFMRRRWGLVLGPFGSKQILTPEESAMAILKDEPAKPFGYEQPLHDVRNHRGFVNLDNYKDWILHWPPDPSVQHPRLALLPENINAVSKNLQKHPAYNQIKDLGFFEESAKRRELLWNSLMGASPWYGPRGQLLNLLRGSGNNWLFLHFLQGDMAGWAPTADELLAFKELEPERRDQLRTWLAALASAAVEPDANPRGSMVHLGNPNMPINRFMVLPLVAALIPDHPHADRWLDLSRIYIGYKLAMNTAPGGAWSELISYYGASAPSLVRGALVLEHAGRRDENLARLATLPARFTLDLLSSPDPRFNTRIVPGWGHEGAVQNTHWMSAAALNRRRDPELAKAFAWAWDQTGRPMASHQDHGFSPYTVIHADLLENLPKNYLPPNFSSTWMPGFGATLRDKPGTAKEIFFTLRNGYLVSHSDANQGDFVLYAYGAPLVTMSLHAYPLDQVKVINELYSRFGWHNRPRFGSQASDGGWPGGGAYGGIPAYHFSDQADYLRAWGDYNGVRWTRQILMVKGENTYFVLRDSFRAPDKIPDIWWNMRTLGPKEQVQPMADGFRYASAYSNVTLEVRFPGLTQPTLESRDVTYPSPLYHASARCWAAAGSPILHSQHADYITVEETLTVNAVGPVQQDLFVILYPRRADSPELIAEQVGPDSVRVTCGKETRTLFLSPDPIREPTFQGLAGFVQDRKKVVCDPLADPKIPPAECHADPQDTRVRMRLHGDQRAEHNGLWAATIGAAADAGVVDLTFYSNRVVGTSQGKGRLLYLSFPPALDTLPVLVLDGQTYAPGTIGNTLIVPIMPGRHEFEVRAIDPPPIFRNGVKW